MSFFAVKWKSTFFASGSAQQLNTPPGELHSYLKLKLVDFKLMYELISRTSNESDIKL